MRFKYDPSKSREIKTNPKREIDFDEAQEIFSHFYYESRKRDDPLQYRVIGWVKGQLFSLIYEVRDDAEGEYYHLVTLWKSTKEEGELYAGHYR
jgi:uncharacterized DUF497 family protein